MSKPTKKFSNWFNLRTVVVLLAVFILFSPVKPSMFNGLDRLLFSMGIGLMNQPAPEVDLAVVTLSEAEYLSLREEWGQAQSVGELLGELLGDRERVVGILYDQPPRQIQSPAQRLLERASNDGGLNSELKAEIKAYAGTRNNLVNLITRPQVIHGVQTGGGSTWVVNEGGMPYVPTERNASSDLIAWLPAWLQPQVFRLNLVETPVEDISVLQLTPFVVHQGIAKTLIINSDNGVHSEFLLRMYARRGQQQSITWLANEGVRVDSVRLPLSPDGSFVPYYQDISAIKRLSLAAAIANPPTHNMILIGSENSPVLERAALDLLSLDNQHYFYAASWVAWAQMAVIALILFYLVILIPRMSYASAVFASCLFLFVFIVAQLGWQITQQQYLPLGIAIQFLVLGHVLMLLWTLQRDNWNQLQAAAHGARYQLGLQLFRDGRSDDALLAVKECYSSDAVLALMYDIASQQERKRQYGEAVKTYQAVIQRQSTFRDVREKVEKLIAFSSGTSTGSFGADSTISKTLIVSESSINKPVLGRYEIERELGRGAMGIVYLGRDPKIARQVAIKTLSYNNIAGKELDEFKERFFREAEAAGRLSHPNIVTIYDVGEEHDLAFIAMDYVEGLSLGAYSSEDHLLPVEDVYKIIIDVAEALSYAHGKNVVHRDIKPSNIMYEPQSGKVKVTDFGVARIVDSSRTQTGDVLGSPLYMSPEQLKGSRVTQHTDIYSLGVTFYQLLTGKLPHTGNNLANLTYSIIHEKHVGVRDHRPELSKSLTRIVNKALNKEPEKRYSNAGDFAVAVSKALQEDFVV
jgi:serine/threonine-protein kinase